ncbi:GntR family transcriptional regulator [Mycobacterium sp. DSM 3803]|nr:GntR family transcriptional regulator [Mycobacterium sp. DSM 3803]OKH80747.1 GntR family transcriptional regulator [Mycobacterium sp. SWH-M3]
MSEPAAPTAPPRYFQVKLALAELIAGLDRGVSLPPERQLAEQLGTSRTTLRKALAELAGEGVLRRTQGSGNFVAPPKVVHVRQLSSLTDDLKAEGMQASSQILGLQRVRAEAAVAEHLEIAAGERIHLLTRLRLVDGEPLAIEEAHLPGALPRLEAHLTEKGSLYAAMRDCYGRVVHSVEDTVETALATPHQAELLGIATGQPLLLVHRTSRDEAGNVIEWTRSVYRGDRFRFVARA